MTRYADIRSNLDVHPITGDLLRLTDEAAISNEIRNLLFTSRYERFWDPRKGAGLLDTLFENLDNDAEYMITQSIRECINSYVPRAKLIDVILKANPDQNAYECTIVYQPINSHNNVTLNSIIKRIR